jgi:hypothetical protein
MSDKSLMTPDEARESFNQLFNEWVLGRASSDADHAALKIVAFEFYRVGRNQALREFAEISNSFTRDAERKRCGGW